MKKQNLKQMPSIKNDTDAEHFIESADLSEYDLSGFSPVKFEFEAKSATLNMRIPQNLLNAVKVRAEAEGMPYTRYIRMVLEQAVTTRE
ncbi:BrnA antitoxin family protein [Desulfovibrio sp. OttesenSCG-928-G11]|nr:BrnA antitoxin family protein [Desulfovibrio sp. OttesenSCG-928-G11]